MMVVVMIMMVMMVMLVLIFVIVVMIMMMMVLVLIFVIVVMIMMMVLVLVFVIVVMIVVMMLVLLMLVVIAMIMMVVVMMLLIGLRHDRFQHGFRQAVVFCHRGHDDVARQVVPRGRDDPGGLVVLTDQRHDGLQLLLRHVLRAGEQDGARVFDLIQEELAEVLDVHAALGCVRHRDEAAHFRFFDVLLHAFHGADDV